MYSVADWGVVTPVQLMFPCCCSNSYTSTAGMQGVFTTRPANELMWGYEDSLLQLLVTLLPAGSLQDGPKVGRPTHVQHEVHDTLNHIQLLPAFSQQEL